MPSQNTPTAPRSTAAHEDDVALSNLNRVTIASAAGTVVEWFDFAIYGFTASILAKVFFPTGEGVTGLLYTFAVFAVAFAMRPLGGAIFGRLGDRVGRKRVLTLTVILMSLSTGAIGLMPGHQTIGILAPVLLTLARCLQGLSAGGEYAGAVAYTIEHAPAHRRARYGAAMPAATFGSFAAAALMIWILTEVLGDAQMLDWGWRVPFLVAAPLGLIAFYIRSKLSESPAFREAIAEMQQETDPHGHAQGTDAAQHTGIVWTIRTEWRQMALLGGYISVTGLSFYMFSTYMTTFLREVVGLEASLVLLSNVLALVFATALAPLMGIICDHVGRKPIMYASAGLLGILGVPAYLLAGIGSFGSALGSQAMLALGAVAANVVTAVLLVEAFPTRSRYTASAITYNVSYAIFGGTVPYISTWLVSVLDLSISPAIYLAVLCALSLIAISLMPETKERPLIESLS